MPARIAVRQRDPFLTAVGGGFHPNEDPRLLIHVIFEPDVDVNAVGPDVDVLLFREIAFRPFLAVRGIS